MENFKEFTNEFSIAKTLRNALIPIGETGNNIMRIINEDEIRKDNYTKAKKIIDRYHKQYIEETLSNFKFHNEDSETRNYLLDFYNLYKTYNKDEKQKEEYEICQLKLREKISKHLTSSEKYKRIGKKELFTQDLPNFITDEDEKKIIEEFSSFTTYFTNFHTNRKNIYSAEAQSTSIAYRLIHQNLPKFIDNIQIFENIKNCELKEILPNVMKDFKTFLDCNNIEELFSINYYNQVITQKQIDIYNLIIGGYFHEGKADVKIKGLNEYINLYNQKQTEKSNKIPTFNTLYKQILSDRNSISWLPDEFESDNDLISSIKEYYTDVEDVIYKSNYNERKSLLDLFYNIEEYDLNGIYITNDSQLTEISNKICGHWGLLKESLSNEIKKNIPIKKKETEEEYNERVNKVFNSIKSFSIETINNCLKKLGINNGVESYFNILLCGEDDKTNIAKIISDNYKTAEQLLNNDYPEDKNLIQDNESIEKIKALLDSIKQLQYTIKALLGNGDETYKDNKFYSLFSVIYERLNKITPLYNMVRNYITKKPYSTEKIKLNFENSTLLDGWDVNKEKDNTSVILRKDGLYYLAIMNKSHNKLFEVKEFKGEGEYYEKMEYKLLPGPNKMLPKVFFSKSRINEFNGTEIKKKYDKGTHKKGENFNLKDCHSLIDFFKTSISKHEDWSKFNFKFSDTEMYEDISGFYKEVEQQGYKISFKNISKEYIDKLVNTGKLYLFQIYNKDFSTYSKGNPNLHTIYWKMLFDENNLNNVVYKLNGGAEVYYRKASIEYSKATHPANIPIKNKNKDWEKKESIFNYDLIKDKRYSVDKFFLHVPITINFKSKGESNLNNKAKSYIKNSKDMHIIGIDRGERHLIYVSVIDMRGNIIEQFSLNTVNNYNYHNLLEEKASKRKKNRQDWKTIGNIKDIKEGYLSQVIHKISELMVKYNAIVVLEDLNLGFKQGRQKVEKEVYQKFEKMLIDKLNCLIFKNRAITDIGGALNAYQLTNEFTSFEKLGKQSGFLFYVPAWNTSKMDPTTGFVNLFGNILKYENIEKSKDIINKFKYIKYNQESNLFEFKFDYKNFTNKAEGSKTEWSIYSYGNRIETFRNKDKNSEWDNREIDLTKEFKELFKDFDLNKDLKESIINQDKKDFFEKLFYLIRLTLQMRNSISGSDVDYLISPIKNDKGEFYDSRTTKGMPDNADANGAYNIARKGLCIIKQIKESNNFKDLKLSISNKEWLKFAQNKDY